MHNLCTTCAQNVHRFGASAAILCSFAITSACAPVPTEDTRLLRNPTVPIGAISRFDADLFEGQWQVETAAGDWPLKGFDVAEDIWREDGGRVGQITALGRGIFQITYDDAMTRDVWVVWIDPDHNTAALGDPEGTFGAVVTRVGARRADQIRAAKQVLDFNGYRTDTWGKTQ